MSAASDPTASAPSHAQDPLREEIAFLGEKLGETIAALAGDEALALVEQVRRLAWQRRSRSSESRSELARLIAELDDDQLRVVIRAFTIFLDLANLAEDRQRIRVLRQRERAAFPAARGESVRAAVEELAQSEASPRQVQRLLEALDVELVFTSHPTEAKRRSVRRKLTRLRELLGQSDGPQLPAELEATQRRIAAELAKLWQTDFIRPWRPSVMQEVERGLSITPVLWDVVAELLADLRDALQEAFGDDAPPVDTCLRFGSWIGGDRDGHPGVTPEITEQTVLWLRNAALDAHLTACRNLFDSLSLSQRQVDLGQELSAAISLACQRWPNLQQQLAKIPPGEVCRQWIRVIYWRLRQTLAVTLDQWNVDGAYPSGDDLVRDVAMLREALDKAPGADLLRREVQTWLDRIAAFGFHLARLDVRQDARRYRTFMDELLEAAQLCNDPHTLDEPQRQRILVDSAGQNLQIPGRQLSPETRQAVELFRLLHRVMRAFGPAALGGHVISMTHAPSDVLAVLWLWRQTAVESLIVDEPRAALLPIVPLLETIDDLQNGPRILDEMFSQPTYREYVRRQGDRQTVMIGYSDSTKDGDYLAACWALYRAQQELAAVARRHGVELTFFHGRGGSLGRGGGPTARSIRSLPAGAFNGSLRLTEQGEVLADRYDDPRIAYRHLEQLIWSCLLAAATPSEPDRPQWREAMNRLNQASLAAYRELVEQPGFVEFFRTATPIAEIEQLPIGSRPARRTGGDKLSDLRAIPWVFSWTQCRLLIPAWYGLGTAVESFLQQADGQSILREMYQHWPFFRATFDNAELAIAKADLDVAEKYADLAEASESIARVKQLITSEFRRTRRALLTISGNADLLEQTKWLKESIRMRNRYTDPLNLIQINLLRRLQRPSPDDADKLDELRHLTRLTINGIAAGMRTSG